MQETTLFSRGEMEMINMAAGSTDIPNSAQRDEDKGGKNLSNGHGAEIKSNGSASHSNGNTVPFRDNPDSGQEDCEL